MTTAGRGVLRLIHRKSGTSKMSYAIVEGTSAAVLLDHHLVVCTDCCSGVKPTKEAIRLHYQQGPHRNPKEETSKIWEALNSTCKAAKDADPSRAVFLRTRNDPVVLGTPSGVAVKALPFIEKVLGWKCEECNDYIAPSMRSLRKHVNAVHAKAGDNVPRVFTKFQRTWSQAFFLGGKVRRLQAIKLDEGESPANNSSKMLSTIIGNIGKGQGNHEDNDVTSKEQCAFAAKANGNCRLRALGISREDAVQLSAGIQRAADVLIIEEKTAVRFAIEEYIQSVVAIEAKRGTIPIMYRRAAGAPGTTENKKPFSCKESGTTERYSLYATRMILTLFRVMDRQSKNELGQVELRRGVRVAAKEFRRQLNAKVEQGPEEQSNDENSAEPGLEGISTEKMGAFGVSRGCRDDQTKNLRYSGGSLDAQAEHLQPMMGLVCTQEGIPDAPCSGNSLALEVRRDGGSNETGFMFEESVDSVEVADHENNEVDHVLLDTLRRAEMYTSNLEPDVEEVTQETVSRALHTLLTEIYHEPISSGQSRTFAEIFVALILFVEESTGVRVAYGREVSPVLAALAHLCGCTGILSIMKYTPEFDSESEAERISKLHSPDANVGINALQEVAGYASLTRESEPGRAIIVSCTKKGQSFEHMFCSYIAGIHLSVRDVGNVVKKIHEEIDRKMVGRCGIFLKEELPVLFDEQIVRLKDDERDRSSGYSFESHPSNQEFAVDCDRTITRLMHRTFECSENEEEVMEKLEKMLCAMESIAELIVTAIHLSGGVPGRPSEDGIITIRNSADGGMRTIFVCEGRVMVIPQYAKQRNMNGGVFNVVTRHPDKQTSRRIIAFISLCVRSREAITRSIDWSQARGPLKGFESASNNFVLSKKTSRKDAGRVIANCWRKFGLKVHTREYRQWICGYASEKALESVSFGEVVKLHTNTDNFSGSDNTGDVLKVQAGHSLSTHRHHYGRLADGIGNIFMGVDSRKVSMFKKASEEFQKDCGLDGETPGNASVQEVEKRIIVHQPGGDQSEPTSHLQCLSGSEEAILSFGKDEQVDYERQVLQNLRKYIGDSEAQFTSTIQKKALITLLQNEKDALIVDRTGGGKSTNIFVSMKFEESVTVYIVPLKSLQIDIAAKCGERGVQWQYMTRVFEGEALIRSGVVITSPEHVAEDRYREVVGSCHAEGNLRRIVIDEVHVISDSDHFRMKMAAMRNARPSGIVCPLVLLTATAPRNRTLELVRATGARADIEIMRGDLRRDNVHIIVSVIGRFQLLRGRVRAEIMEVIASFEDGKCIVSVLHATQVQGWALQIENWLLNDGHSSFSVLQFHGQMTDHEKKEVMGQWATHQRNRLFVVCTEAFGTGIDAPDVYNVIIVGMTRSLTHLWQVAGRVGRGGVEGNVRFLYEPSTARRLKQQSTNTSSKRRLEEVESWIGSENCRVAYLEEFFGSEGEVMTCLEKEESGALLFEPCENCEEMKKKKRNKKRSISWTDDDECDGKRQKGKSLTGNIRPIVRNTKVMAMRTISQEGASEALELSQKQIEMGNKFDPLQEEFRENCVEISRICVICAAKSNPTNYRLSNGRHGYQCVRGRCHRCSSMDHMSRSCTVLRRPDASRSIFACTACGIYLVGNTRIHRGGGNGSENEFGNWQLCPFSKAVRLAIGLWRDNVRREHMLRNGVIPEFCRDCTAAEYSSWLVEDRAASLPGIVAVVQYVVEYLNLHGK